MMAFQPVFVKWHDAHAGEDTWHQLDDDDPYMIESCGFLIPDNEGGKSGHVTLVQNITPDEDVDHVIYIPSAMVQSITFLTAFTPEIVE